MHFLGTIKLFYIDKNHLWIFLYFYLKKKHVRLGIKGIGTVFMFLATKPIWSPEQNTLVL